MEASDQQQSPPFLSPQSVPGVNQEPERPAAAVKRRAGGAVKKASKRKTRAATKPPIRVLSADKSSFRNIVLQLTGVPSTATTHQPRGHLTSSCSFPSFLSKPQNDGHSSLSNPPNYVHSQNHGHLFGPPQDDGHLFGNPLSHLQNDGHLFTHPFTSLSNSHSHFSNNPMTSLSCNASHASSLPHSLKSPSPTTHSPYARALPNSLRNPNVDSSYALLDSPSEDAMMMQSEILFSQSFAILQALRHSLSYIIGEEGCGSPNGLLGHCNHDSNFDDTRSNDNFGLVDFGTPFRSQENKTPKDIMTISGGQLFPTNLLDMEHLDKSCWQVTELESFLLTGNDAAR